MSQESLLNIHLLSDGTGETGLTVLKAVLVQYHHEGNIHIQRHRNVRSKEQVEAVIESIGKQKNSLLIYTTVLPDIRTMIQDYCKTHKIKNVDLLEDLITHLDSALESRIKEAGLLRSVNEQYFKRIEAMEYSLRHDDGQLTDHLEEADIILVGVSRTSKTPLSIFLSYKGWKVANIPMVYNIPPPENLFRVNQKKIIALTINPEYLFKIRKNRLEKFGYDPGGDYADKQQVCLEVSEIQNLFRKQKWPVLNITERALEETATEIVRIISMRMKLPVKVI